MKKIIWIILISFLILGCRTKKVLKTELKQVETTQTNQSEKRDEIKAVKETEINKDETIKSEFKNEEKQQVEITGKSENDKPLSYYNIVNGDTIDLFKVTGNADVIFKSYKNTLNSASNSKYNTEYQKENKSENIISSVVNSASETVKNVKEKSVQVVKKNFSFGTYAVFVIWGIIIISLLIGIYYLRKSTLWTKIIKIFRI